MAEAPVHANQTQELSNRLFDAICDNNIEQVKICINEGVDLKLVAGLNVQNDRLTGACPLASACLFGHEDIMEELLKAGADPNQVSASRWPLPVYLFPAYAPNQRLTLSMIKILQSYFIASDSLIDAMFLLTEMRDTVRVPPWAFDKPLNEAIMTTINSKMSNKVVHNLGLVLTIWDITKLEDSYVFPGDGASHTIVHFRTVIFRPFLDEIITGQIKSCCKEGVYVTLGFFDDILIPSDALQHPSKFDEGEQLWVWQYQTDGDEHELFMDIGEEIRLRVIDETFVDITPSGPEGGSTEKPETETETKKSPYSLIASISEPGLGLLSWWNG